VARKNRAIYEAMLVRSVHVREANFDALGPNDLELLFGLYDSEFFGGALARMLAEDGVSGVSFRPSNRLTRAAGKTMYTRRKTTPGKGLVSHPRYEIAVSTFLLFENFRPEHRAVSIGGLPCRDRLEALQRIFEHELLHLSEFLAWDQSSCTAPNFHALSQRIFGHAGTTHELVTPREVAERVYDFRIGDRVSFVHEGIRRVGRVNRITKRVTVLVEDHSGRPFSDGRNYATYYVPMPMLSKET
jgi:hypothetical protein